MKIATDIASWNAEARKYHLSYGQYERAVEHGELPPPKAKRNSADEPRKRICASCGDAFVLKKYFYRGKIHYSEAKYCDTCRVMAQCYRRKKV